MKRKTKDETQRTGEVGGWGGGGTEKREQRERTCIVPALPSRTPQRSNKFLRSDHILSLSRTCMILLE